VIVPRTGNFIRQGVLERGHSVSLLRPTYPPESSSGSAGSFQRGILRRLLTGHKITAHCHTTGRLGI